MSEEEQRQQEENPEEPLFDPIAGLDQAMAGYRKTLAPNMAALLTGLIENGIPLAVASTMVAHYFAMMTAPPKDPSQ